MRILIDMQGAQTESRFRGIGRYTIDFAKAVIRNCGEHEIVLALNGLFKETIEPIRSVFDGLLPQENIRVWYVPGPVAEIQAVGDVRIKVAEYIREAFLMGFQPDVIHVTSLFEGYVDDAVTSINVFNSSTPITVTLFDLIPLVNSDEYLKPNPRYAKYYERKIMYLRSASKYFAISEFSRQDVIKVLGVPESKAVNISTACDISFQPQAISEERSNKLFARFSITRPFVLYTGGADERKNLPRLIEAYASLPGDIRNSHHLIFAGKIPEGDVLRLKNLARSVGLSREELLFTGYISDEELIQLYNLCRLYIFPSWYEGFGLPALEAMACGAPVIGAKGTSLSEVIGYDDALFDPFDIKSITSKIEHALKDLSFRNFLSKHGLDQAKKFSWDETARLAISAWVGLSKNRAGIDRSWKKIKENYGHTYRLLIDRLSSIFSELNANSNKQIRHVAVCIEKNEQEIFHYLRPVKLPKKILWRIEGPFDSSYSLALVNREVSRSLAALGHQVLLHSTEGPGDFSPNKEFLLQNPDLAEMHNLSTQIAQIDADIVSRNLYPPRVEDMDGRFNFLHTYGWEESGFPLEWVDSFNVSLQGMTVMSRHVRKIMIDHGVQLPITVSSLGVDHWLRINSCDSYKLAAKSFRFLHVSSCFPRKGIDILLQSYGQSFNAHDDVTLVIKTFPNPHNEIHKLLEDVRSANPDYPDVIVLEEDYTDSELKALYNQCHALVAPSRAEGFGLPMAEAMLSGLAVITTGWGGQIDFCNPDTAWLIDYSFARAKTHFNLSASIWAEPDEKHLASIMKEVFLTPLDARNVRITNGQRILKEKFSWSNTAKSMVKAAHNCALSQERGKPRIGWVSTWGTPCGIAIYSEHLVSKIPADITVFAAHSDSELSSDDPNVSRCWAVGDEDNLTGLKCAIEKHDVDTLVIQFNYGFFDLETFSEFLISQVLSGRIVVLTLHATIDPPHVPHKKLSLLATALRRCHRVLVHSPNDMNRLKQLGVVENVSLFPLGVIDYESSPVEPFDHDRPFRIASYGFFLPHKGLIELIDAVNILYNKGLNVRLNLVNAAYPVSESEKIIKEAKRKIEIDNLTEIVSLCTDFLSDSESLLKLSEADLIVFPYQETGESASAAVRYGIASGKPVAVTPLHIFEDIQPAVHFLPNTSIEGIAEGIEHLLTQIIFQSELFWEKNESALHWRNEYSYSKLGRRLYGMLISLKINS